MHCYRNIKASYYTQILTLRHVSSILNVILHNTIKLLQLIRNSVSDRRIDLRTNKIILLGHPLLRALDFVVLNMEMETLNKLSSYIYIVMKLKLHQSVRV